jgi:hypothetical protein
MFDHCISDVAKELYPLSIDSQNRMINDFKLLTQSLKTTIPLLIMSVIGWSFSIISVTLEGILVYYFYQQLISLYTSIRSHNIGSSSSSNKSWLKTSVVQQTPSHELYMILKRIVSECAHT